MIVVTGLPRSGTSLMMRMLEAGGVDCLYDDHVPADEYNPHGYYEHQRVMSGYWPHPSQINGRAVKAMTALFYDDAPAPTVMIVMRRDLTKVAASLTRMRAAHHTPVPPDVGYLQGQIDALRLVAASYRHVEIWLDDLLRDTAHQVLRVARTLDRVPGTWCPEPLDLAAMAACVERELVHH